ADNPWSSPAGRFEQLDRIASWIFNLNLFAARADFHFISKTHTCLFQVRNAQRQILHLKYHAVPSSWLLLTAIGHWPRSRSAGTAQDQLEATNRNQAKSRQVLHIQIETKRLCIESNCLPNIFNLISNTPKPHNESPCRMR